MEGVVCNHQKFGSCKYKQSCKNKHLEETCQELSACLTLKSCEKRHPKKCKRYANEGFCWFGTGCAYHHQVQSTLIPNNNTIEINIKVEKLEKMVHEMAETIVTLESKLKEIESKDVIKEKEAAKQVEDPKNITSKKVKSKDTKEKKAKEKIQFLNLGRKLEKLCQIKYNLR